MNNTLDVLCSRRSIRKFKNQQVKQDDLDLILKAGTYAPTGKNTQEPIIVAIQDEQIRNEVSALSSIAKNISSDPYYGAPTIIIVFAGENRYSRDIAIMDGASVTTNILNAAHSINIGSCWINTPSGMFDSKEGKELIKLFGLSEDVFAVASIALGYADCENSVASPRKDDYIIKL